MDNKFFLESILTVLIKFIVVIVFLSIRIALVVLTANICLISNEKIKFIDIRNSIKASINTFKCGKTQIY